MKIAIGSDHAGYQLKERLIRYLKLKCFYVEDFGTYCEGSCDYPEYAAKVAQVVSRGEFERGVLICKSGIGMSIVANKVVGIRAALCYNLETTVLSRQHNDANVLVMGAAFVESELAEEMLEKWLATEFLGGRHSRRVTKIGLVEQGLSVNTDESKKQAGN